MPVPDTKYNKDITRLRTDLSNISLFHNRSALDTNCEDNNKTEPYLTSKASYLINQFSKVKNCSNKFSDNQNARFKYRQPKQPSLCVNDLSSSFYDTHTQKLIQKQVRVASSLYTMNLASLTINSDLNNDKPWNNRSDRLNPHGNKNQNNSSIKPDKGIDVKFNGYTRYLGKKKSNYLKTQLIGAEEPKFGNKTKKLGLLSCPVYC